MPNDMMRAVQVLAPGKAEFIETPKPRLKPGHALVRTHRLSLCGSDIRMLHYSPPDHYPFAPGTTGHEMVGVIEAIDAPGSPLKVGDMTLTLAPDHRAMAEYYVAPVADIFALPPGKPVEHLLQAQQVGTVIYACKQLPSLVGKTVAIIGQGSAGLWFAFMARRMGARRVIALDLQEFRLKASQLYGATHTIANADVDPVAAVRAVNDGELADVVVEAAGEVATINLALDLVREWGFILYFGVPRAENFNYHFEKLFYKRLRVQGIVGAGDDPGHNATRLALELIQSGELDVGPILTHHFPFAQVLEAYELQHTRDESAIKIVIDMPG
jgi:threonine dehydrogenase-like Zn-dependent dehydrogenase